MGEVAGWTGVILAIAGMIRGEVANHTARKVAREKAESDRLAARDKMEFDAQLVVLKTQNATQAGEIAALKEDQKKCKEENEVRKATEAELKGRIDVMQTMMAARPH